jgi:hypothetical protein
VIFGLKTRPLPTKWTPLDAVAVIKCLNEDGELGFVIRSTKTLSSWESVGLLKVATESQINDILEDIEDEDLEDENDGEEEMS